MFITSFWILFTFYAAIGFLFEKTQKEKKKRTEMIILIHWVCCIGFHKVENPLQLSQAVAFLVFLTAGFLCFSSF
jgi:hypothetical protein